jgi:hypothetical protein
MQAQTVSRVRADWLPRAIVSGYIAGVAMLLTFLVAYGVANLLGGIPLVEGGHASGPTFRDWFYRLTHNALTNLAGSNIYAVAGLHFAVAMVWAGLYAYYAEPRLIGSGWTRGAVFSVVPWLVSVLIALPLGGGGVFGTALGAGPLPVIGNLILHLAYGATLGAVYGPLGDLPADGGSGAGEADDFETTRRSEVGTAEGIIIGLFIGLAASGAVALLGQVSPGSLILGIPQAALVLGGTLLGGAFGGLLGSYVGLTPPR